MEYSKRCVKVLLYVFSLILSTASLGSGISISKVKVESPIISGQSGWFKCDWNNEGDSIYSVQWYLGVNEFYRWSPSAETPVLVFNTSAFQVDKDKSRKGHVFVRNVSLLANGIVRCVVSGEKPFFQSDGMEQKLRVVDLPDSEPIIASSRTVYDLHQEVVLTCTSPRSKPAAVLDFYINDEKAETSWVVHQQPQTDNVTSLETAILGLRFSLSPRLIHNGKVDVKCTAGIDDIYWESNEKPIYVAGTVPQRAPRMDERDTTTNRGTTTTNRGTTLRWIYLETWFFIALVVLCVHNSARKFML